MCHQASCGCEQHSHAQIPRGMPQHHEGCWCGHGHPRRFLTKEESIQEMEDYLKQLHAEAEGVEESIAELKKEE